jgi:hypothetical protein
VHTALVVALRLASLRAQVALGAGQLERDGRATLHRPAALLGAGGDTDPRQPKLAGDRGLVAVTIAGQQAHEADIFSCPLTRAREYLFSTTSTSSTVPETAWLSQAPRM